MRTVGCCVYFADYGLYVPVRYTGNWWLLDEKHAVLLLRMHAGQRACLFEKLAMINFRCCSD